ncbi:MAG: hypothetical protein ACOYN0_20145, partial [Phycisphaerales bacterium]
KALGLGLDPRIHPDDPAPAEGTFTKSITITGNILSFGSDPVRLRARAKTIMVDGSVGSETNPVQSWEVFRIGDGKDQLTTITQTVHVAAGDGAGDAALVVFRTPAELRQGLRIHRVAGGVAGAKRFAVLRFEKGVNLSGTIDFAPYSLTDPAGLVAKDVFELSRMEFRDVLSLTGNTTIDLRNAGPGSQGVFFFKGVQAAAGVIAPDFSVMVNTMTPREFQRWVKRRPVRSTPALSDANVEFALDRVTGEAVARDPSQSALVDYRDVIPVIAFGGDVGSSASPLGAVRLNVPNGQLPIGLDENGRFVKGSQKLFRELVPKVATISTGAFGETMNSLLRSDVDAVLTGNEPDIEKALKAYDLRLNTVSEINASTGKKVFGMRSFYSSEFIMGFNEKLTSLSGLSINATDRAFLGDLTSLGDLEVKTGDPNNRALRGDIYLLRRTEGALRTAFASVNGRGGRNTFNPKPARGTVLAESLVDFEYDPAPGEARAEAKMLATPLLDKGLDFVAGGQTISFIGRIDANPDVQSVGGT